MSVDAGRRAELRYWFGSHHSGSAGTEGRGRPAGYALTRLLEANK